MFLRLVAILLLIMSQVLPAAGASPLSGVLSRSMTPQMNFTVEGKINKLSENKLTLSSEENMLFHVRFDDKTEIKRPDGSAASAKDLHVGLKVRVDGDLEESGEIAAHRILIEPDEPPKKTSRDVTPISPD